MANRVRSPEQVERDRHDMDLESKYHALIEDEKRGIWRNLAIYRRSGNKWSLCWKACGIGRFAGSHIWQNARYQEYEAEITELLREGKIAKIALKQAEGSDYIRFAHKCIVDGVSYERDDCTPGTPLRRDDKKRELLESIEAYNGVAGSMGLDESSEVYDDDEIPHDSIPLPKKKPGTPDFKRIADWDINDLQEAYDDMLKNSKGNNSLQLEIFARIADLKGFKKGGATESAKIRAIIDGGVKVVKEAEMQLKRLASYKGDGKRISFDDSEEEAETETENIVNEEESND